jgi:integrase
MSLLKMQALTDNIFIVVLQMGEQGWIASLSVASSSVEEIVALLRLLREPARTAVLLDVLTGLRVGELLALKWNDIDFQKSQISVTRSIFMQRIGDCKTEASRKPVPMDLRLASALYNWRMVSPYPRPDDWILASPDNCPTGPAHSTELTFYRQPRFSALRVLAGTPSDAPTRHSSRPTVRTSRPCRNSSTMPTVL